MLPAVVKTGNIPVSPCQMCPTMRKNPSQGHRLSTPSTSSLLVVGWHRYPLEGQKLCQVDVGTSKHSKTNVSHEAVHIMLLPLPWDPGDSKNLPGVIEMMLYPKVRQKRHEEILEVHLAPQARLLGAG